MRKLFSKLGQEARKLRLGTLETEKEKGWCCGLRTCRFEEGGGEQEDEWMKKMWCVYT